MTTEPIALKDQFEFVREIVKHEETLKNFRTTWTLVFHGFLFSAYVGGVGLFEKSSLANNSYHPVQIGLLVICTLAILSAIAAFLGFRAAEVQLKLTTDWWCERLTQTGDLSFPPIFIHSKSKYRFAASTYFLVLAGAWVVLTLLVLLTSLSPILCK